VRHAHSDDADQPFQADLDQSSDRSRSALRECAVGFIPNLSVQEIVPMPVEIVEAGAEG
jgi:hypothetical protein